MKQYLKNPIILAIIVGAVMYMLMTYFYNPTTEEETSKSKNGRSKKRRKKKQTGFFTDKRETVILVSVIAALGTWFLAKTYIPRSDQNAGLVDISGDNAMKAVNPVSGILGNDLGSINGQDLVAPPRAGFQPAIQMGLQEGQQIPIQNQQFNNAAGPVFVDQQLQAQAPRVVGQPTVQPTAQPTAQPTVQPAVQPTAQPMAQSLENAQLAQNQGQTGGYHANAAARQIRGGSHGMGKSYNLIGSGLDMPRNSIPRVLIDY